MGLAKKGKKTLTHKKRENLKTPRTLENRSNTLPTEPLKRLKRRKQETTERDSKASKTTLTASAKLRAGKDEDNLVQEEETKTSVSKRIREEFLSYGLELAIT